MAKPIRQADSYFYPPQPCNLTIFDAKTGKTECYFQPGTPSTEVGRNAQKAVETYHAALSKANKATS